MARSRRPSPTARSRSCSRRSAGTNIGLDFLPGALAFASSVGPLPDPDLAASIVWFDAYVTNVDRTPRNPNLIVWHRRLHLIDHGSALYIHHTWRDPLEHARRPFEPIRDHVLLPFASSIVDVDARLSPLVTRSLVAELAAAIPDDWLPAEDGLAVPDDHRRAYVDYLMTRLDAPRAFVEEAERARAA